MTFLYYLSLLVLISSFQWINASDQILGLCEGQRGFIRCGNGTKIKIVSANYGRIDDHVCPGGTTSTRTCVSKTSEIKVKWNCNGYSTCHIEASSEIFGNPCANYKKYLEVRYKCVNNYDNDMKDKPIIAFNAYTSKILTMPRNTPITVVYDTLYFNYGNAYNPQNGVFTAPSAGLYVFTWTSVVNPGKIFDVEIVVNGKRKGMGNCNNELSAGFENCGNTVPLVLKPGDQVYIRTIAANFLNKLWSSFKGWKL